LNEFATGSKSKAIGDATLQFGVEPQIARVTGLKAIPGGGQVVDISVYGVSVIIAGSAEAEKKAGQAIGNYMYDSGLYSAMSNFLSGG
jgi:hypothetical protein